MTKICAGSEFANKDKTEYLAPVGNWCQKNWKKRLTALKLTELSLSRVPKSLVCRLKNEIPFTAVPDRGNWEYLYKVSDLIGLKGAGYKNKRRQLNRFWENYNYEYHPLGLREIPDLIELQRVWLEQKEITINNNLLAEHQAVLQLLENWQEFSSRMLGGVLYADGLPIAYTLAKKADREYLIVHFEKALYRYKGAYPDINWLFLKHLPESFEYVNRGRIWEKRGFVGLKWNIIRSVLSKNILLPPKPSIKGRMSMGFVKLIITFVALAFILQLRIAVKKIKTEENDKG